MPAGQAGYVDGARLKNLKIKRDAPEFPVSVIRSKTWKGFRRELRDAKAAKGEQTGPRRTSCIEHDSAAKTAN
jgi:hypothetical protein